MHRMYTYHTGNQPIPLIPQQSQQYNSPAAQYSNDYDNNRPRINEVPLTISQMNEQMDDYRLRHHKKPWWLKDDGEDYGSEEKYSDKLQVTAFLMSLFLGFGGAGRIYVGDVIGYYKLGLCILVCCYPCILSCSFAKKRGNRRVIKLRDLRNICGVFLSLIGCGAFLALIGWIVTDIVLFGLNDIPDGDGLTLQPWEA